MKFQHLRWQTPPENQGQIVVIAYAWDEGFIYRRVFDQSNQSYKIHKYWPWNCSERDGEKLGWWDACNGVPPTWVDEGLDESPIIDEFPGIYAAAAEIDDAENDDAE